MAHLRGVRRSSHHSSCRMSFTVWSAQFGLRNRVVNIIFFYFLLLILNTLRVTRKRASNRRNMGLGGHMSAAALSAIRKMSRCSGKSDNRSWEPREYLCQPQLIQFAVRCFHIRTPPPPDTPSATSTMSTVVDSPTASNGKIGHCRPQDRPWRRSWSPT